MLGYNDKIKEFIEKNFEKGHPDITDHWFTTKQILHILFTSFPEGCIDDYELNEMLEPKFDRKLRVLEYEEKEDDKIVTKKAPPAVYWIIKIEEKQ